MLIDRPAKSQLLFPSNLIPRCKTSMKSTYGLNAIFSQENSKKGADEKKSRYFLWKPNLQIFNCGSVSVQSLLFKRDHPTALTCRIQSPIGRNPSKQKEDPVFPFQKCQLSNTLSAHVQFLQRSSSLLR